MNIFRKIDMKRLPEYILVAVFFINMAAYGHYLNLYINNILTEDKGRRFEIIRHFSEVSLLYLLLFFYVCFRDRWRYSLKFLLYCLSLLWINNTIYYIFRYESMLYYHLSSLILYTIGVVLGVWVLTRR